MSRFADPASWRTRPTGAYPNAYIFSQCPHIKLDRYEHVHTMSAEGAKRDGALRASAGG